MGRVLIYVNPDDSEIAEILQSAIEAYGGKTDKTSAKVVNLDGQDEELSLFDVPQKLLIHIEASIHKGSRRWDIRIFFQEESDGQIKEVALPKIYSTTRKRGLCVTPVYNRR